MEKTLLIYHRIMKRENFEKAAHDIFDLVKKAQESFPNQPRKLVLDIDGHRLENGALDHDMFELVSEFLINFMGKYLTEITSPLYSIRRTEEQVNDIPDKLLIGNPKNSRDDSLDKLYIENYSNTELLSEESMYLFLERLSNFLKEFQKVKASEDYLLNS